MGVAAIIDEVARGRITAREGARRLTESGKVLSTAAIRARVSRARRRLGIKGKPGRPRGPSDHAPSAAPAEPDGSEAAAVGVRSPSGPVPADAPPGSASAAEPSQGERLKEAAAAAELEEPGGPAPGENGAAPSSNGADSAAAFDGAALAKLTCGMLEATGAIACVLYKVPAERAAEIIPLGPAERGIIEALAPSAAPYVERYLAMAPAAGAALFGAAVLFMMGGRMLEARRASPARAAKGDPAPPPAAAAPPSSARAGGSAPAMDEQQQDILRRLSIPVIVPHRGSAA